MPSQRAAFPAADHLHRGSPCPHDHGHTAIAWPPHSAPSAAPLTVLLGNHDGARLFGTDPSVNPNSGIPRPFLGGNVGERFRERPPVARRALGDVLPFAMFEVGRAPRGCVRRSPGSLAVSERVRPLCAPSPSA